jgi:isopentenyl diphosphate isomerase/L-lactate dehydrogenase-like FMN-dependent dehydrogenase
MNGTAVKAAAAMLALGVTLGGCATRESVEHAQLSADTAERHAGVATARADEAWGVGNNALAVGNDAKARALAAEQKADQANADLSETKMRVAYLESKQPHKKKHRHHVAQPKPSNS